MVSDAGLDDRLCGSVPYLTMCATAVAGWQLVLQARAAGKDTAPAVIARTKPVVSRYFLEHVVPEAAGLKAAATGGSNVFYELDAQALAG